MMQALRTASVVFLFGLGITSPQSPLEDQATAKAESWDTGTIEDKSDDAFQRLNDAFRDVYQSARKTTLTKSGPIILVRGDQLTLINNGRHTVGTAVDRQYHDLKTVAHVPLAVYLHLVAYEEGNIDDGCLERLEELRRQITAASGEISQRFQDKELAARQRELLTRCGAFVSMAVTSKRFERADLVRLLRKTSPQVHENVDLAVELRIDNYHAQITAWRETMELEEWNGLRVVISGAAMPRQNNLATQYFARLLHEKGEGPRIVYAESMYDEQQALDLLATHLLDTQIGADFFADRWRMHRDLLGPAATRYLDRLEMPGGSP